MTLELGWCVHDYKVWMCVVFDQRKVLEVQCIRIELLLVIVEADYDLHLERRQWNKDVL